MLGCTPCSRAAAALLAAFSLRALPPQAPQAPQPAAERVAAHAGESRLTLAELDRLIGERYALGETGRAALRHLMRARLLDQLARESRLTVTDRDVDRRSAEIEAEMRAAGGGQTLDEYLAESGVSRAKFREFLRLGIVQESLARRALGIPEGRAVPGEQQEMWLDQVIEQRGTQTPPPPWPDGVAARCGNLEVLAADFLEHLRDQLEPDVVRESCYQALLARRVRARFSDLAADGLARAVSDELARRRADVESDPKYRGLSYEQVVAAQGSSLEALPRDPAIVAAALAHLWVDRTYGEEGLVRAYGEQRAWFDGRFGEARELRVIFRRAAQLTNALNPRGFAAAESELEALKPKIANADDFARLANVHSEDARTRENGGSLGWVAAGDENVPETLRAAAFAPARDQARAEHRLIGPVRLQNGVALLWVGASRPAPGWDEMRAYVHRELRRRFLDDVLPKKDVSTYLDES